MYYYKKDQKSFLEELVSEFNLNSDTLKCYTLESNPKIKVMLFGQNGWDKCHIGFLINKHFHVLGLGQFSCIKEDAKALYIALNCTLPQDEQKLKVVENISFYDEEQKSIKEKLSEVFPVK